MRAIAISLALLAVAVPARAQECSRGRTATAEGYCCWPGQRWDDADQRCEGPPACPAPLEASGTECVERGALANVGPTQPPTMVRAEGVVDYGSGAASSSGPPGVQTPGMQAPGVQNAVAQPTGVIGSGWPLSGQLAPQGARNPRRASRSDEALQATGALILGLGYAATATQSAYAFSSDGIRATDPYSMNASCHEQLGATFLIPIVGGIIAAIVAETCSVPSYTQAGGVAFRTGSASITGEPWAIIGGIASAVQIAGFALLLAGSFHTVETTIYEGLGSTLSIAPTFAGGPGVQSTLRF